MFGRLARALVVLALAGCTEHGSSGVDAPPSDGKPPPPPNAFDPCVASGTVFLTGELVDFDRLVTRRLRGRLRRAEVLTRRPDGPPVDAAQRPRRVRAARRSAAARRPTGFLDGSIVVARGARPRRPARTPVAVAAFRFATEKRVVEMTRELVAWKFLRPELPELFRVTHGASITVPAYLMAPPTPGPRQQQEVTLDGVETIDGHSCWRLVITTPPPQVQVRGLDVREEPMRMWIDQRTHLLIRRFQRKHFPKHEFISESTRTYAPETW